MINLYIKSTVLKFKNFVVNNQPKVLSALVVSIIVYLLLKDVPRLNVIFIGVTAKLFVIVLILYWIFAIGHVKQFIVLILFLMMIAYLSIFTFFDFQRLGVLIYIMLWVATITSIRKIFKCNK